MVAELLVANSLDVNASDGAGNTALMWAAGGGHTEKVRQLLATPGINVNAAAMNGNTALMTGRASVHSQRAS